MAKLGINTGIIPNDGTGDHLLAGAVKINSNFNEIYTRFGDGSNLTSIGGTWASTSVGIHTFKKVGIGTTNPTSILTVAGDIKVTGIITASNFVGSGVGLTGLTGIAGTWAVTSIGIHTLKKVGIGTTNPRFALEVGAVGTSGTTLFVNGDARITGIVTIGPASITLNGSTNIINVGTGITIDGSTGIISATSIVLGGSIISGAGVTSIVAGSGITISQSTGNVTITASGSGIGLSISDTPPANTTAYPLWYSSLLGRSFVYYNDGNSSQWVDFSPTSSGGSVVSGGSTSQWNTTAAGIHTLSNVGIGTTNPTSALTVKGNTSLETLNVSGISTFGGLSKFLGISSTRDLIVYGSGNESGSISTAAFLSRTNYLDFGPAIPYTTAPTSFSLRLGSDRAPSTLGPYDILSAGWSSIGGGGFVSLNNWNGTSAISINNERLSISHLGYTIFGGTVPIGTLPIQVQGGLYISGNVGLGTTNPTSKLTVTGNVLVSGIITASSFSGNASSATYASNAGIATNAQGLTGTPNLNVGIITATSFVGDGSGLTGVVGSGSGIVIKDSGSTVGTAGTIDFGDNLTVSAISAGIVTVTGSAGGSSSQFVTTAAGIHTLSNVGIGTTNPTSALTVKGNTSLETLNVSGVSTLNSLSLGALTNILSLSSGFSNVDKVINFGGDMAMFHLQDGTFGTSNHILINEYDLVIGTKGETGGNTFYSGLIRVSVGDDLYLPNTSNVSLGYGDNTTKLQTIGTGITVTGTTFTNNLSVSGIASVGTGITMYGSTGIISATTFYGNVVGNISGSITDATNLTGGYANASQLNVSGVTTISQGRIQADGSSNLRFGNIAAGSGSGRNIAIGDQVLYSLSSGQGRNIGIGELSYYDTTSGQYNIGLGIQAGQKITTGNYNVILGGYDGQTGLDIRTSSNNVVIADGQGNIRQYINSSGNVGIKTTVITEALTVSGIVSATSFYGTLNAGQLTGSLPAINGSALIGVVGSGSGVIIQGNGTPVGTAGTINFASNLNVTFASGIATVSGASSVSNATTAYGLAGSPNVSLDNVTAGVTTLRTTTLNILNTNGVNFETAFAQFGNTGWIGWRRIGSLGQGRMEFVSGFLNADINLKSSSNIILENFDGLSVYAGFSSTSSYLNHNNSKKFETTGYGVSITGGINAPIGIITASSFSGSGSGLTNLPAGQLTGTLPAIDGSALLNVTAAGTGIAIRDDNSNIGSATTVNFGTGLDVTFSSGIATITASGGSLQSRTTVSGVTTSIANLGIGNTNITGFKSYALMKVGLSTTGWLRLYTDSTSRANDASRSVGEDPAPGSGVIAEVVTTGITTTQIISPFVMGGNLDNSPTTTIYAAIKNLSGTTQSITANLTILQLEA